MQAIQIYTNKLKVLLDFSEILLIHMNSVLIPTKTKPNIEREN